MSAHRHIIAWGFAGLAVVTAAAGAVGYGAHVYTLRHPPAYVDPVADVWRAQLHEGAGFSGDAAVTVLVELESEQDAVRLRAWGAWIRFCWSRFCTVSVPDRRLDALAQLREVEYVKFVGPEVSASRPARTAATMLAVIDEDIDWRDRALWTPNGPRALYFWDQTDATGPPAPPGPAGYGTELTSFDMARLRNASAPATPRGHGTAMAAVAVGSAGAAGGGTDTPLLLVNTTGRDVALLDAIRYVVGRARQADANLVINLSAGKHFGRHDGTDPWIAALDATLDDRTLLLVSVGNDAHRGIYADETLRGSVTIPFVVKQGPCAPGTRVGFELEGWYDGPSPAEVQIQSSTGATAAPLGPDHVVGGQSSSEHFLLDTRLRVPGGQARGLHVTAQANCAVGPDATWRFTAQSPGPGRIRMWVTQTKDCEVVFVHPAQSGSFSAIAASRHALAVGAYVVRDGLASEAAFSSSGQLADGRWKPDVLAPTNLDIGDPEQRAGGTSAATAFASGFAVRLWSPGTHLTATDLRRALARRVLLADGPGPAWPDGRYHPAAFDDLQRQLAQPTMTVVSTAGGR